MQCWNTARPYAGATPPTQHFTAPEPIITFFPAIINGKKYFGCAQLCGAGNTAPCAAFCVSVGKPRGADVPPLSPWASTAETNPFTAAAFRRRAQTEQQAVHPRGSGSEPPFRRLEGVRRGTLQRIRTHYSNGVSPSPTGFGGCRSARRRLGRTRRRWRSWRRPAPGGTRCPPRPDGRGAE